MYKVEEAPLHNSIHFNGRYCFEKQGVAMGTKLGASVACTFMENLEEFFYRLRALHTYAM